MHTVLGQAVSPAVVKGLCPRNGGHGVGVLVSLEQGQTQKMKGQDQQGTSPSRASMGLWSGRDPCPPPPQVPELSAVFVKARIPSLYLDSDFSMLALAN